MIKKLILVKIKIYNKKILKLNKFNNFIFKIKIVSIIIGKKEYNLMDKLKLKKLVNLKKLKMKEIKCQNNYQNMNKFIYKNYKIVKGI